MPQEQNGKGIFAHLDLLPKQKVFYNLSSAELVELAVKNGECYLANNGAMIVETGEHTGRSPNDKYIVDNGTDTDGQIAWGKVNKSIPVEKFDQLFRKIVEYLETKDVYVQDALAGRDASYKKHFRIISEKAYAALFTRDLLFPLANATESTPDFTILHAPDFYADPSVDGTRTGTFIVMNFAKNLILIGGTSYAGEIKKSVFTTMNRILPEADVFPMHCSANIGKNGDTALFFGLSGTGKTTLSSSPDRYLIGDDEHGWSSSGIFNFENGCYAKTINLSLELEPMIWHASQRFGAVLENVGFDPVTREIDFSDGSKTENTRAAYPISYIEGYVESGQGNHPTNIFFLSADAFGVLPPISLLSREQAVYYFLLGYTAKLAGTEKGLGAEPEATFSTCFGEPFLPLSPSVYANLLLQRIDKYHPKIWLINTGWSGGAFGNGSRIKLPYSRAMIKAALEDVIPDESYHRDSVFGLSIPNHVENVPDEMLDPINTWANKDQFNQIAQNLVQKMVDRMSFFSADLDTEILNSGPGLNA